MAKCVNCAWFPWKPGADYSMLPAMRCSSKLAARRWTPAGVTMEHECPEFKAADTEVELPSMENEQAESITEETLGQTSQETTPTSEQVVPEQMQATLETQEQSTQEQAKEQVPEQEQGEVSADDAYSGTEGAAQKAAKRANTSRRKR